MKKILLITILILMIATPVLAQSQTYFHEVTVELDGEWDFDSTFASPEATSTTKLVGVGKAMIHAITKAQSVPVWWDLF
jgi:uncharacterized protein YdeI (BOF family)